MRSRNPYSNITLKQVQDNFKMLLQESKRFLILKTKQKPIESSDENENENEIAKDGSTQEIEANKKIVTTTEIKEIAELKGMVEIQDIVKFKSGLPTFPDVSVLETLNALKNSTLNQEVQCVSTVLTYCFGNYKPCLPFKVEQELERELQKSQRKRDS